MNYAEIDTYVLVGNEFDFHVYQEELNQTLRALLNGNGWRLPQLTTTEVNSLLAGSYLEIGMQWYNSTDNLMQIMTNSGVRSIDTSVWS